MARAAWAAATLLAHLGLPGFVLWQRVLDICGASGGVLFTGQPLEKHGSWQAPSGVGVAVGEEASEGFVGPCERCGQAACRQQGRGSDAGRWRHVNIGESIWQGL